MSMTKTAVRADGAECPPTGQGNRSGSVAIVRRPLPTTAAVRAERSTETGRRGQARRVVDAVVRRVRAVRGSQIGAATAEYAIAMLAAVGFAGLLVVILKGNAVKAMLTDIVKQALGTGG